MLTQSLFGIGSTPYETPTPSPITPTPNPSPTPVPLSDDENIDEEE